MPAVPPELGRFRPTPIQQWFLTQRLAVPHHFNQSVLLDARSPIHRAQLAAAFAAIVAHHDALRLRVHDAADGWQLRTAARESSILTTSLLAMLSGEGAERAMAAVTESLHTSLDLERGPVVRAALFDRGVSAPERLLIVIHQLAIDPVSWSIVLEDLETALEQQRRGLPITLPPQTTSFEAWSARLADYAQSTALARELPHWQAVETAEVAPLPRDLDTSGFIPLPGMVVQPWSREATALLLRELPRAGWDVPDVLLAALAGALAAWTGSPQVRIDVGSHGRESIGPGIDLTRTVGWLSSRYPIVLEAAGELATTIAAIEDADRRISHHGLGYGILRYLTDELPAGEPAEVSFQYVTRYEAARPRPGSPDPWFVRSVGGLRGTEHNPCNRRPYLIEVVASVVDGELRVTFLYDERNHRRSTIEALAQRVARAIDDTVVH